MLAPRTEREYRRYIGLWKADGQPEPALWVNGRGSAHAQRNARAALVWHHRQLGRTVVIPVVPSPRRMPQAFTEMELARLRLVAPTVHYRCGPVLDLLYSTGARLSEARASCSRM
jgi:site-specific recombinase XerD